MNAERRLARLESALSPKEATLLWLTDAHQFPTLPAYVAWLVDQPKEAAPFWRVPEQAETAVRATMRGEPRSAVTAASHQAVRDAVFLVELVIRLNVEATETIRIKGLRYASLCWEARAIAAGAEVEPTADGSGGRRALTRRWAAWREAAAILIENLCVAEQARAQLECRYLDGSPALFPDLAADLRRLREHAEGLTSLGDEAESQPVRRGRRATLGSGAVRSPRQTAQRDRAQTEAAHLADLARGAALDLLGDTDGAGAIAERHLRLGDR